MEYICKIATIPEMEIKWDYEINKASDKDNWITWKKNAFDRVEKGISVVYHGVLDGKIIAETTAIFDTSDVQNGNGLADKDTAYLEAFRVIEEYQGQGYFSKLFKFMIEDLKKRGYKKVTLGVEPCEVKNMMIYFKYGFTTYLKTSTDTYPDGTEVIVNYYSKEI